MSNRPTAPATLAELIRHGGRLLRPSESSELDAELLLAHSLNLDRLAVYRDGNAEVAPDQRERFEQFIRKRASGRPVAQLLGSAEFWSLSFLIDASVLIPRPETELLVETALDLIPRSGRRLIADLGTGSGAIAVALAVERRGATIVATDLSAPALRAARRNCVAHRASGVHLLRANWLHGLRSAQFDMIVSNPPYVCADDPLLSTSDIRFEPKLALVGGSDGLAALRAIAAQAPAHLKPGGFLLLEHGYNQGGAVRRLLNDQGFGRVTTVRDLAGLERLSYGRREHQR